MQHVQDTIAPDAPDTRQRTRVGTLSMDTLNRAHARERIRSAVAEGTRLHVVTANMQFLGLASRDAVFADIVHHAGMVVGDGVPLLWLSRLRGTPISERITGHDLVDDCAELSALHGFRLGLLGGSEGAAQRAAEVLCALHPGATIAGVFDGRFSVEGEGADDEAVIRKIEDADIDILLVALGCPKQEQWIANHASRLSVPVSIGVGSVFDVLAGYRQRAPVWMQRSGLEWTYRFKQEPARLWRRYVLQDIPAFAAAATSIAVERFGKRGTPA